ncbi:MAG: amino acid ABC transporter permease [Parvibaculaceae bacterium]
MMSAGEIVMTLLKGLGVTLEIAVGAWILSVVLGIVLGAMEDMGSTALRWLARILVTLLRSMPQLVMLYLLYFGIGAWGLDVPGVVAAILALGITESAFAAEYYRAALMTVPPTQREAGTSLGLTPLRVFRLVVLPQALPYAMAPLLNSFISLLKLATLAAAVGSPEILYRGQSLMQLTGQMGFITALIIAVYIAISVPLSRLAGRLEAKVARA